MTERLNSMEEKTVNNDFIKTTKDERDDDDDELVLSMVSPSYSSFSFSLFFVARFEKQTRRDLHRRREEEEE